MGNVDWTSLLERAARIVRSYDTGVTVRQLFYRLVSDGTLPNTRSYYSSLSSYTADARRGGPEFKHGAAEAYCAAHGQFPDFVDQTREIHRPMHFDGADDALRWLRGVYRRDRTEGQDVALYVGIEKRALVSLVRSWFSPLGVPVLELAGFSSQTYCDDVAADVRADGRRSALLYAGDFDPSGVVIDEDFRERVGEFDLYERVALNEDQVREFDLPPQMGKATDTRASAFVEKYGRLIQVELDALPPDALRSLFREAIDRYWSEERYERSLEREADDLAELEAS